MMNNIREPSYQEIMLRDQRELARLASRPSIDHLADAVVDGKFVVPVGGRLVIDRLASILSGSPWLDTRCYTVRDVNQETGLLLLSEEETQGKAMSNFRTGIRAGYTFKTAPTKGSWVGKVATAPIPRKRSSGETKGTKGAASSADTGSYRRVYNAKGLIHTRVSGTAFAPNGETKAQSGDKLMFKITGDKCNVTFKDGTRETWFRKAGF